MSRWWRMPDKNIMICLFKYILKIIWTNNAAVDDACSSAQMAYMCMWLGLNEALSANNIYNWCMFTFFTWNNIFLGSFRQINEPIIGSACVPSALHSMLSSCIDRIGSSIRRSLRTTFNVNSILIHSTLTPDRKWNVFDQKCKNENKICTNTNTI